MQDPKLCKGLLQRILPGLKIDRIEYPETQKAIRPDIDAKSVRFDAYVEDGRGTVYDIEMQEVKTKLYHLYLPVRPVRHGQAYLYI